MLSFDNEEREVLLDQRWLELLISVLGERMGDIVTGKASSWTFKILKDICIFI